MEDFETALDPDGDINPEQAELIPERGNRLEVGSLLQPISNLMRTRVATIDPTATVSEAIREMADGHFGCVLVAADGRLVGILSERDIVTRVVRHRLDTDTETVGDHMTGELETLRPSHPLAYALNIMSTGGFRHVPVTDEAGCVKGILSLRDIGEFLVEHFREEILTLPPDPQRNTRAATRHGG